MENSKSEFLDGVYNQAGMLTFSNVTNKLPTLQMNKSIYWEAITGRFTGKLFRDYTSMKTMWIMQDAYQCGEYYKYTINAKFGKQPLWC